MSACCICMTGRPTDGVLIDGSVFHTRCLQDLKQAAELLKDRERRLLAELHKPLSFVENISIFFFQSRQMELLAAKRRLSSQIESAREEYETTFNRIRLVYDLWPTYPPDWEERQRLVMIIAAESAA